MRYMRKLFVSFGALALAAPLCAEPVPLSPGDHAAGTQERSVISAREAVMPALAVLPRETEAFLAFKSCGRLIAAAAGASSDSHPCGSIDSVAISFGKGSSATVERLLTLLTTPARTQQHFKLFGEKWLPNAKPMLRSVMKRVYKVYAEEYVTEAMKAVDELQAEPLSPLCIALTAEAGQEKRFAELYDEIAQMLCDLAEDVGWQAETKDDRVDVRVKISFNFLRQLCRLYDAGKADEKEIHLRLCKHRGAIVLVVSDKADSVNLPDEGMENLLAHSSLARLSSSSIGAAWVSQEMCSAYVRYDRKSNSIRNALNSLEGIFRELGSIQEADKDTYDAAAESVARLNAKFYPEVTCAKPFTLDVRKESDGEYGFLATGDAFVRFEAGTLKHGSLAEDEKTIFYVETTPVCSPFRLDMDPNTCISILKAYACTQQEGPDVQDIEKMRPELEPARDALDAVMQSLSAPYCMVVSEGDAETHGAPMVGLSAGVRDRSGLALAWGKLLAAADVVSQKLGGLALPHEDQDASACEPGVAALVEVLSKAIRSGAMKLELNDKSLAIGSSEKLNKRLCEELREEPFCGAKVSVRPAPLLRYFYLLSVGVTEIEDNAAAPSGIPSRIDFSLSSEQDTGKIEGKVKIK